MPSAPNVTALPGLGAIVRRGMPHLLEATLVPAALFYVVVVHAGPGPAMVATLAWSFGALARRLALRRRIPSILVLALVALSLRTLVGVVTGSAAMYFLQPILTTVAMAVLFLGSLVVGRPLVASLASDFCPLEPDVTSRPGVVRLFRRLTVLWAGVHLATAATTLGLLVRYPLPTFVALKTLSGLAITGLAVMVTVLWARRTAHTEGLLGVAPERGYADVACLPMLEPAAA